MERRWINKLDDFWALIVKELSRWQCEHCRIRGIRMEAAHVVGRRHRATRWGYWAHQWYDLCGHCLCHNCHQQYDEHGPLEGYIVSQTIGVERKAQIQAYAVQTIARNQDFMLILNDLWLYYEKEVEMPKGTPVDKMYRALLKQGESQATAAKISQSKTGKSLKTGRKPRGK